MAKKFEGKYELVDVELKSSVIEARKLFLELILKIQPEVSSDLMRLFNIDSIPDDSKFGKNSMNLSTKLFLLHTKFQHLYKLNLTDFGYLEDVRKTPILAFFDFILRNQSKISEIMEQSETKWDDYKPLPPIHLKTASAIDEFIPDWKTLKTKEDSDWICSELESWSAKWNLKFDWVLDFALDCLKDFKESFIDRLQFSENYMDYVLQSNAGFDEINALNGFWKKGWAWSGSLPKYIWQRLRDHLFLSKFSEYPTFEYEWKNGGETCISIQTFYNPLVHSPDEFRLEIEKEFWHKFFIYFSKEWDFFVGNKSRLTNKLIILKRKLNEYFKEIDCLLKKEAIQTTKKISPERHFEWLVEYQVLGKSIYQLAKEKELDSKTVSEGIDKAANHIEITASKNIYKS